MIRTVSRTSLFSSILAALTLATVGCASAPDDATDEADDDSGEVAGTSEDALTRRACGGRAGNTCGRSEYCKFTLSAVCGHADGQGVCAKKPSRCTSTNSPVCGCNGVTYRNACQGRRSGQSALHRGACVPEVPTDCPAGKKQCMMCGTEPPDGICRAFICVAPSVECPLVP
jgi:hypothetical protein